MQAHPKSAVSGKNHPNCGAKQAPNCGSSNIGTNRKNPQIVENKLIQNQLKKEDLEPDPCTISSCKVRNSGFRSLKVGMSLIFVRVQPIRGDAATFGHVANSTGYPSPLLVVLCSQRPRMRYRDFSTTKPNPLWGAGHLPL